jgi:hypothetical protein
VCVCVCVSKHYRHRNRCCTGDALWGMCPVLIRHALAHLFVDLRQHLLGAFLGRHDGCGRGVRAGSNRYSCGEGCVGVVVHCLVVVFCEGQDYGGASVGRRKRLVGMTHTFTSQPAMTIAVQSPTEQGCHSQTQIGGRGRSLMQFHCDMDAR